MTRWLPGDKRQPPRKNAERITPTVAQKHPGWGFQARGAPDRVCTAEGSRAPRRRQQRRVVGSSVSSDWATCAPIRSRSRRSPDVSGHKLTGAAGETLGHHVVPSPGCQLTAIWTGQLTLTVVAEKTQTPKIFLLNS